VTLIDAQFCHATFWSHFVPVRLIIEPTYFLRLCACQVTLLNHEAAPESSDIFDWFKEVTLFKRSPSAGGNKRHFVAYTNGKSGVRLAPGVVPAGPHRFTSVSPARRLQSIVVSDQVTTTAGARGCTQPDAGNSAESQEPFCYPVLLHFVNCGFEEWRRKCVLRGTKMPWRDKQFLFDLPVRASRTAQ
jgi:hypothetical protein